MINIAILVYQLHKFRKLIFDNLLITRGLK